MTRKSLGKEIAQDYTCKNTIDRTKPIPLGFTQQLFWFLDESLLNNSLYNRPRVFELTGQLNVKLFEQALNTVIQRYEILRTTFDDSMGMPTQVIAHTSSFLLVTKNLTESPKELINIEVKKIIDKDINQRFDLAGPFIRCELLKLSNNKYLFYINIHPIIIDSWSLDILLKDLSELYCAFIANKPCPLPKMNLQYPDYALWEQNKYQSSTILEEQLQYWKNQFLGLPEILSLPLDNSRTNIVSNTMGRCSFSIDKEILHSLTAISHQENTALSTTLLTVFVILLYRYTNQEDILIGLPVSGRNSKDTLGLVGVLGNHLAIPFKCENHLSFLNLLNQNHKISLAAFANQNIPFEFLIENLKIKRNSMYHPIFQVMFSFNENSDEAFHLKNIDVIEKPIESIPTKLDLTLNIYFKEDKECLATFEYHADLFDKSTIELPFRTLANTFPN